MIKAFQAVVPNFFRNKKKVFRKLILPNHSAMTISAVGADTSEPDPVSSDAVDTDSIPVEATMIGVLPLHL